MQYEEPHGQIRQYIVHTCNITAEAVQDATDWGAVKELHGSMEYWTQQLVVLDFAGAKTWKYGNCPPHCSHKPWNSLFFLKTLAVVQPVAMKKGNLPDYD